MSTTKQVKEELRIYEAFENSPVGSLIKEGRMHLGLRTDVDKFQSSWYPMSSDLDYFSRENFNMTNEEIDKLLEAIQPNLSLIEKTDEPMSISSKYGYVIFEVSEEGKVISFGTVYNIHEIFDIRHKNDLLPTT